MFTHMANLNTPRKTTDWSVDEVRDALHSAGWSMNRLAKHHGLSVSTIRLALYSPFPRSEARIAEALQVHPCQIWPSRYDTAGEPNRKMGRPIRAPLAVPRVIPRLRNHDSTGIRGRKVHGVRADKHDA